MNTKEYTTQATRVARGEKNPASEASENVRIAAKTLDIMYGIKEKIPGAARIGAGALAIGGLLFAAHNINQPEDELGNPDSQEKYDGYLVEGAESLRICDGALVREDPWKDDNENFTNLITEADLDGCIEVKTTDVYKIVNDKNGEYYGAKEKNIAEQCPDLGLDPTKANNIVWVNWQKSSVNTSESDSDK